MPTNPITSETRQGPRSYQEDYCFSAVIENPVRGWLLAVMDGHGGKTVAELAAREIGELFRLKSADQSEKALRDLISALNERTKNFPDVGSTISAACILKTASKVSIAVLGDSPVVVLDGSGKLHVSPEHNIRSNLEERKAVQGRGGICEGGYLYTYGGDHGLQMSRALGDFHLYPVLSHEPDIYTISDPQWILVASDGIFDPGHKNTHHLLNEIEDYAKRYASAKEIIQWAENRGLKDNATALVWHREH